MKVFVTGIAGFIGGHVAQALLDAGHEVEGCDNLSTGRIENVPDQAECIICDVREIRADAEVVIHLAGIVDANHPDDSEMWRETIDGTIAALKIVEGAHFVLASTAASIPAISAYGQAKRSAGDVAGLFNATVLRLANVYGPRQRRSAESPAVLVAWREASTAGSPIVIYGDGQQTRDFVHVKDVARAFVLAAEQGVPGVFDVCTGRQISIACLADSLYPDSVKEMRPARPGDPQTVSQDPEPAREAFGFEAEERIAA